MASYFLKAHRLDDCPRHDGIEISVFEVSA